MWSLTTTLVLFTAVGDVGHQDRPAWLGAKVVLISPTSLQAGDRVVGESDGHRVFTVRKVNGQWLWLVSRSGSGWARSTAVVPLGKAVAFYTEQIQKRIALRENYLRRAFVLSYLGDDEEALTDVDEVLRLGPNDEGALCVRGLLRLKMREYPRALADFDGAIRLNPNSPTALENRGKALVIMGRLSKSLLDLDRAIELRPDRFKTYVIRGAALNSLSDFGKGLADFNEAIRLNPYCADAYACRAILLALCPDGKYRDVGAALKSVVRACEITYWQEPEYLGQLAQICGILEDYDKAGGWQQAANKLFTDEDRRIEGAKRLNVYIELKEDQRRRRSRGKVGDSGR